MSEEPTPHLIHPPAFVVDTDTLRSVVRDAVGDALERVGLDPKEAKEVRADLAYLRAWRTTMQKVKSESLAAAVKWATLAMISALIVGLGVKFGVVKIPPV